MKLSSSGLTHVGMKRSHNEDCLRIYRDQGLFIVADGMGGHASGEVASEMSVEALARFYTVSGLDEEITWPFKQSYQESYQENRVRVGVQLSNRKIYESAVYDVKLKGMGTTIVTAAFYEDKFTVGHVGDSRVYHFRGDVLRQVTEDHSLLNDYIKMRPGGMTAEEIKAFPHKNVIVRALGMKENVQVDIITEQVSPGDLLLLCSDGLSGMLTDEEMHEMITHAVSESGGVAQVDLDDLCVALINGANRNGGNDNVTVILVRCDEVGGEKIKPQAASATLTPAWAKQDPQGEAPPSEGQDQAEPPSEVESREVPARGHFQVEPLLTPRSGATPAKVSARVGQEAPSSDEGATAEPEAATQPQTDEGGERAASAEVPEPEGGGTPEGAEREAPSGRAEAQADATATAEEPGADELDVAEEGDTISIVPKSSDLDPQEKLLQAAATPNPFTPPEALNEEAAPSEVAEQDGGAEQDGEAQPEGAAQPGGAGEPSGDEQALDELELELPKTLHGLPVITPLEELESLKTVNVTQGEGAEETLELVAPDPSISEPQDTVNMLPSSEEGGDESGDDPLEGGDQTEVSTLGGEGE